MGGGCLFGFTRLIGRGFWGLGAFVARLVVRSIGFLMAAIVAPFCLGLTRQTIHSLWNGQDQEQGPRPPRNRLGYALLAGLLWVVGYVALRFLFRALNQLAGLLFGQVMPAAPPFLAPVITVLLIFVAGALVGLWIHGRDQSFFQNW